MNPTSTPPSHPAPRRLLRLALSLLGTAVAGGALTGCGGYSLREGIWELKIADFVRVENGHVLEVPAWTVKVAVAKHEDPRSPEHIEDVEITPLPPATIESAKDDPNHAKRMGRQPFFADIRRKEEGPTLFIVEKARDESWFFQMTGTVKDDETIVGQRVFGRVLYTSDATFQGKWSMRWLRDE